MGCLRPSSGRPKLTLVSSQEIQISVLLNRPFLGLSFGLNPFPWPNGRLSPVACHTYLESHDTQLSFGLSGNNFSASNDALNFLQHLRLLVTIF